MRLAITVVLLSASHSAANPFYDHISAASIHTPSWSSTSQQSEEHTLGFTFPLLGSGTVDKLYISNFGAVSYNSMGSSEDKIDEVKDNILIAPLFVKTSGALATVKKEEILIADVATSILAHPEYSSVSFTPTNGLLITWEGVSQPADSSKTADFQMYIVTNGLETFAIFNYKTVEFTTVDSEDARAGVYVESEDVNICHHQLNSTVHRDNAGNYDNNNNLDLDIVVGSTNCGVVGRWVMRIGHAIPCVTLFESACGMSQEGEGAIKDPYFENKGPSGTGEAWDFFMHYTCQPTLIMDKDVNGLAVTTKDSYCLYDADYYTNQWSCEVNNDDVKCFDPIAAQDIEIETTFTGFPDNQTLDEFWVEETDPKTQERIDMEDAIIAVIKQLLEDVGLVDAILTQVTFEKLSVNRELSDGGEELVVSYEIKIAGADVQAEDISTAIEDHLTDNADDYPIVPSPEVNVKDKTPACLTMCLGCKDPAGCLGTPPPLPPNMCCGTCANENHEGGKPYNTLDKVCCYDTYLYEKDKHACCIDESGTPYLGKGNTCD